MGRGRPVIIAVSEQSGQTEPSCGEVQEGGKGVESYHGRDSDEADKDEIKAAELTAFSLQKRKCTLTSQNWASKDCVTCADSHERQETYFMRKS